MVAVPARTPLESAVEDRRLSMSPVPKKQEVAQRAGVTPSYLRRVLSGNYPLSADLQARLEQALGLPRRALDAYRTDDSGDLSSPPHGSRYNQKEWDRLTDDERRFLINVERKALADDAHARAHATASDHPDERRRKRGA